MGNARCPNSHHRYTPASPIWSPTECIEEPLSDCRTEHYAPFDGPPVRAMFENLFHACHASDKPVNSNAAVIVENEFNACSVQAKVFKDSVLLHGIRSLDHPSIMDHLNLMNSCVQKYVWAKVCLFLESDRIALISLCEGRPSKEVQRCLNRVSLDVSKFFELPCGKSVYPYKFD